MSMLTRDEIIDALKESKVRLRNLLIEIRLYNLDGYQFDFVSHPRLFDEVDGIKKIVDEIDNIVYQNK